MGAVIALVAITADATEVKKEVKKVVAKPGSCGKLTITTRGVKDTKCAKKGTDSVSDMTKTSDVCTDKKKVTCDTTGYTTTHYTDKECKTVDTAKGKKAVTTKWGACVLGVTMKGAEALKMAVTGATLALVASQF